MKTDTAKRFREARWRLGLSRRQVAERANGRISEATIVNAETDGHTLLPQTVFILADALGLDASDFLDEEVAS